MVYLAHDQRLANRACAIKEMVDHFIDPQQRIEANDYFAREADTLAQLKHRRDPRDHRPLRRSKSPLPGDGVRRGAQPRRGDCGARRPAARRPGNRHRAPALRRARLPARFHAARRLPRHEAVQRDADAEGAGGAGRLRHRAAVQERAQGHHDRDARLRAARAVSGRGRSAQRHLFARRDAALCLLPGATPKNFRPSAFRRCAICAPRSRATWQARSIARSPTRPTRAPRTSRIFATCCSTARASATPSAARAVNSQGGTADLVLPPDVAEAIAPPRRRRRRSKHRVVALAAFFAVVAGGAFGATYVYNNPQLQQRLGVESFIDSLPWKVRGAPGRRARAIRSISSA